jgi:hypothetical protein
MEHPMFFLRNTPRKIGNRGIRNRNRMANQSILVHRLRQLELGKRIAWTLSKREVAIGHLFHVKPFLSPPLGGRVQDWIGKNRQVSHQASDRGQDFDRRPYGDHAKYKCSRNTYKHRNKVDISANRPMNQA